MRYNIASKNCELSQKTIDHIEKNAQKINDKLENLAPDLAILDIVVRKNKKHRGNHIAIDNPYEYDEEVVARLETPKNSSPTYFNGTLKLTLPKKPLVVGFEGDNIEKALSEGFEKMMQEVDDYKGKHYVNDSEYPDKSTFRNSDNFI